MFSLKIWLKKNWQTLAVLALLVAATYANSLDNAFVSDDIPGIVLNKNLHRFSYAFSSIFTIPSVLLFIITYKLGNGQPFFFHLFNIFFHLGNTILVYFFFTLISNKKTAVFTSLIFAVHPVLAESVTWISGGSYARYTFFLLISLIFYVFFNHQRKAKFLIASVLFFSFSLTFSVMALAFPLILFVYHLSFGSLRKHWVFLLPYFVIATTWGMLILQYGLGQRISDLATVNYLEPGFYNPLLQIPAAISSYLGLIFWPKNLTLYHSELLMSHEEYLIRLFITLALVTMIALSYFKNRFIFFWLSFFVISLLPVLTPLKIAWVVAERYVYLGSVGILVAVGYFFDKLMEMKKVKTLTLVVFFTLVAIMMIRTILRNNDWQNEDTLWIATAKTSPSDPRTHNNLGDVYGRHGQHELAADSFKRAIALQPNYADAHHNLGNAYVNLGKIDEAIESYEKAAELNPNLWQSYQALAAVYFAQEKFEEALDNIEKALEINQREPNLYVNLAIVYLKLDKLEEAKASLEKALELDPQNQRTFELLSTLGPIE